MNIRSKLQAAFLAGVSALALVIGGCGRGGTPPVPGITVAEGCDPNATFNGVPEQYWSLMRAENKAAGACYFDPTSTVIPGIIDYYSAGYPLGSLPPGKYIALFTNDYSVTLPSSGAELDAPHLRIWELNITSNNGSGLWKNLVEGRNIGISANGLQVDQMVETNYIYQNNSVGNSFGDQMGTAVDFALASQASQVNSLPLYNQGANFGYAYLDHQDKNNLQSNVTFRLQEIIALITKSTTIDTSKWDVNSFGYIDPVTGVGPSNTRFVFGYASPLDPTYHIYNALVLYIRTDANMSEPTGKLDAWRLDILDTTGNVVWDNATIPYADPGINASGQAAKWDQDFHSRIPSTGIFFPLFKSAPTSARQSVGATANQLKQQLLLPAPKLAIKGLLPAQASGPTPAQ